MLLIGCVPLLIGAVLQVATYSTAQLVVGRVVAGLAMGAITSTLPIWQNETSPPALRGTLICASLSMLIVRDIYTPSLDQDANWCRLVNSLPIGQPMAFWTNMITIWFTVSCSPFKAWQP